jgi:sarcosine oxidase
VLSPERCVAVQLQLAQALGAVVRTGETVLSIDRRGGSASVLTDRGRIDAGRVVLTAGAWLPGLAGGALSRLTAVHRQTLLWFEPDDPALYDPARCPPFIWQHGPAEEDYLYGFPLLPGAAGVKAASERYAGHVEPDAVDRVVTPAEATAIYNRHVKDRLRGLGERAVKTATCLYTVTRDAHFIVDRLHEDGIVIAASACSGHGFKHSPALGERLAQLAMQPSFVPEPEFALARFA